MDKNINLIKTPRGGKITLHNPGQKIVYFVINLNKNVRIHRFKVWQRAYWYNGPTGVPYYYQEENLRSFDLYASNDAQDWTLLGQFDIGDPSDESGNIPQDFIDAAALTPAIRPCAAASS